MKSSFKIFGLIVIVADAADGLRACRHAGSRSNSAICRNPAPAATQPPAATAAPTDGSSRHECTRCRSCHTDLPR